MVERWLAVMLEGIETHLVFTELHTEEMVGETLWDWDWKRTSPRTRTPLERTSALWWCSASLTAPVWRTPRWSSTNCGRVASPAPSPSSWSGTRQTWSDPDKSPSRVRKIWQMRLWGSEEIFIQMRGIWPGGTVSSMLRWAGSWTIMSTPSWWGSSSRSDCGNSLPLLAQGGEDRGEAKFVREEDYFKGRVPVPQLFLHY